MTAKLKASDRDWLVSLLNNIQVIEYEIKSIPADLPQEEIEAEQRRVVLRFKRVAEVLKEAEFEDKARVKRA